MSRLDREEFQLASNHWPDGCYASRPSSELADTEVHHAPAHARPHRT